MGVDPVRSRAISAYLPPPIGHAEPAAVRDIEDETGVQLLEYVADVARETFDVFGLGDGRSKADPERALAAVRDGMAKRHPELDADALNSLLRMWSYSAWKCGGL